MAKEKTVYVCSNCGQDSPKWVGKCPSCGEWNTYVEEIVRKEPTNRRPVSGIETQKPKPLALSDIEADDEPRINMHDDELNRVLGGGLVQGSLVLIGGEPGIGKSTLVMQTVLHMPEKKILYVSGEESARQLKLRADRLSDTSSDCLIVCETSLEQIYVHIKNTNPDLVIIDSIQTISTESIESSPGSIAQVRECSASINKGQQDYLLPFVEDGTLTLIGATTENPYFEVNGALLSRSRIFELKPLEKDDIKQLIYRAVTDSERGMGTYRVKIEEDAADFLADTANGDARAALNAVELGVLTTERSEDGLIHIDLAAAQECIQKRAVRYDKDGDNHYDTISAFIKSMRGSDPDAAVYYLARMLYAGEDIKFIARRIMICASEDVGNADPQALNVAVSAALAAERIGLPEAQIILSQAASYVACAPKSNAAYVAIQNAMENVKTTRTMPVPVHLQDRHYKGAAKLGHGEGYKYAHDYPKHYVKQQYLPDGMEGTVFYEPSDNGYEKQIKAHMKWLKD